MLIDKRPKDWTAREIEEAREELEALEGNWLRSRGWKESCGNPGSLWLWSKGDYRCSQKTAFTIQAALEPVENDLDD